MNECDIQQYLRGHFCNYNYLLCNSYVYEWESDFFGVSKTGYAAEVEIKISKADFKKDFLKDKHFLFVNAGKKLVLEKHIEPTDVVVHTFCERKHYSNSYHEYDKDLKRTVFKAYPVCRLKWHEPEKFFIPNKFYYACPQGLLTKDDIPAYAGLLQVMSSGTVEKVKEAPFLHKRVDSKLKEILLDKFWYLSQRQNFKIRDLECKIRYSKAVS